MQIDPRIRGDERIHIVEHAGRFAERPQVGVLGRLEPDVRPTRPAGIGRRALLLAQPRPELNEVGGRDVVGHGLPRHERHVLAGARDTVVEERPPEVHALLDVLHVDVDLDVRARHVDLGRTAAAIHRLGAQGRARVVDHLGQLGAREVAVRQRRVTSERAQSARGLEPGGLEVLRLGRAPLHALQRLDRGVVGSTIGVLDRLIQLHAPREQRRDRRVERGERGTIGDTAFAVEVPLLPPDAGDEADVAVPFDELLLTHLQPRARRTLADLDGLHQQVVAGEGRRHDVQPEAELEVVDVERRAQLGALGRGRRTDERRGEIPPDGLALDPDDRTHRFVGREAARREHPAIVRELQQIVALEPRAPDFVGLGGRERQRLER